LTLEELSPHIVASIAGAIIGAALGAVVQRTNFCAMGAVSDMVVFQNWNRLRAWFLAMAVAILGTQLLAWAEMIDLGDSIYLGSQFTWAAAILGGLVFGIGMVLAGGCGNRNLVRLGAGDLRSLVVVLVMGLSAGMTLYGLIGYLRVDFNDATALELADFGLTSQGLPDVIAAAVGADAASLRIVLAVVLALAISVFCFSSAAFRQSPRNIVGGLLVGLLVIAGWWATGVLAFDEFEPVALGSLTFIAPVGDGVLYLMTFTGSSISFGIALVGGQDRPAAQSRRCSTYGVRRRHGAWLHDWARRHRPLHAGLGILPGACIDHCRRHGGNAHPGSAGRLMSSEIQP
jgi:uncharacterized membrane protein YedE/YeeE